MAAATSQMTSPPKLSQLSGHNTAWISFNFPKMIDYDLPSEIRAGLRVAKKWYAMGGAFIVLGFLFIRPATWVGIGLGVYAFGLDAKAKKRARQWRKENGYA